MSVTQPASQVARGIGVNVPQDVFGDRYAAELADFADAAMTQGYDSLWVSESLKPNVVDPLAVLNFLAARTTDVTLGVAVLISGLRSPVRLARELASADQLSEGRLIVGLGVGNNRADYPLHGIEPGHRGRHFEAGLHVLKALLTQEHVSDVAPWWRLEREPRPLRSLQRPAPPMWFGARSGEALRRAVRMGDGWVGAGSMSKEDFLRAFAEVRVALDEQEREPQGFAIAKRVYVHLADRTDPPEGVRRWFSYHYGAARQVEDVFVIGGRSQVVEHLAELQHAGVETLILQPVVEVRSQMEMLAEDVMPQLDR